MTEHDFAELAAGHALHALDPDDERAFVAALAQHPEWRHHLDADRVTVSALADGVPEVAPPAALRAGLLDSILTTPQKRVDAEPAAAAAASVPVTQAPTRRAGWGARAWFALAASIALLLGVGAGATIVAQQLNRPAAVVALDRIEAAPDAQSASTTLADGGEATVHWSESLGETVFVSAGLPPIEADQSYELWFVRGEEPIAAGVFTADDSGTATALLAGQMAPGDTIAVTVEPAGGSPTGQPTSTPIVAIPTA
ncbi:MAG: anti-sigma factor [Microbacterium sp.]|jgi:anti-sigma-K factor RskA|uniref:anti-sigma factor n=1 Tax=unclassified Microbacterium TaxID=2609290 RepID=UPI000DB531C0|nr:anti-sigma factor [Microbacterium sp.]PZU37460.1 MAG: anti-sigma factor [Microbacterium sp.]